MGTGDFTIDCWIYPTTVDSTYHTFISKTGPDGNLGEVTFALNINDSNKISAFVDTSGTTRHVVEGDSAISPNTWYHVAFVRDGTTLELYVDGTKQANTANIGVQSLLNRSEPLVVGVFGTSAYNDYAGYVDEIRISKGAAKWTSDFIPATVPYAASPSSPSFNTAGYDVDMSGSLTLQGTGALDAVTDSIINIAGDWTNAGTFNAATNTTVIFDGTGTQDLIAGTDDFYSLTHSGAGTLNLTDALNVSGNLINSAGTLDVNDQAISITGTTGISGGTYNTGLGVNTFTGAVSMSDGILNIESAGHLK